MILKTHAERAASEVRCARVYEEAARGHVDKRRTQDCTDRAQFYWYSAILCLVRWAHSK